MTKYFLKIFGEKQAMSKKAVFPLLLVGLVGGGFYYNHLQKEKKIAIIKATAEKLTKSLKLSELAPSEKLAVTINKKQQPKCWVGDADVLVEDLDMKSADDFLMSIESLTEKDKSVSVKINLQSFYDDPQTSVEFALSKFKGTHAAGLFICSDFNKSGKCDGKEVVDIMDLYNRYVREEVIHVPSDKDLPFRIALFQNKVTPEIDAHIYKDYIYYFQYIYIDDGKVIFPSDNITKAAFYNTLGKYEQRVLGLKKGIKDRIKYAFKTNKTLNNFAMRKDQGGLFINIPYRNRACILGYAETQELLRQKGK